MVSSSFIHFPVEGDRLFFQDQLVLDYSIDPLTLSIIAQSTGWVTLIQQLMDNVGSNILYNSQLLPQPIIDV